MLKTYDVVVLGNGVLGLSTAFALTSLDPTVRVAVLGEPSRPYGATPAAGAMLGCFGEVTRAMLGSTYGRHKLAMSVQATRAWPAWLDALNAANGADARVAIEPGTFVIHNTRSGRIEDENFAAIREAATGHGARIEDVDPRSIAGLDPAHDSRPTRAMFLPDEGTVDSGGLLAALERAVVATGRVDLVPVAASRLRIEGARVHGVETTDGAAYAARHVVAAAGVGTQALLDGVPGLAARIPRVLSGGGASVLIERPGLAIPCAIRTPNRSFSCGLHVMPKAQSRLYVGATNNLGIKPWDKPTVSDVYFLLECAMEQIDQGLQGGVLAAWRAGNRPVSIDGCPLLGRTPSVDGLWMLTGTYRDGLHLSPLLAASLAGEILGRAPLFDNVFQPERRPINLWTRQGAIDEALRHYAAVGWEHGIRVPKVGWHETFDRMFTRTVTSVYEDLDDEFVLPPEFLYLVDNDRAAMITHFRAYYQSVRAAWA